jgi:hypothetical protein
MTVYSQVLWLYEGLDLLATVTQHLKLKYLTNSFSQYIQKKTQVQCQIKDRVNIHPWKTLLSTQKAYSSCYRNSLWVCALIFLYLFQSAGLDVLLALLKALNFLRVAFLMFPSTQGWICLANVLLVGTWSWIVFVIGLSSRTQFGTNGWFPYQRWQYTGLGIHITSKLCWTL